MTIQILFLLMGGLFFVVGFGMAINIVWGLITGGPRARTEPGQPYLYDRLYYSLFLIGLIGWVIALLSFAATSGDEPASGFLIGWGICAVGMGLLFWLRGQMMLKGAQYLSRHGFILFRPFHFMQSRQLEHQPIMLTWVPVVFIAAGIGVLIFNFAHLPQGLQQAHAGAVKLTQIVARLITI